MTWLRGIVQGLLKITSFIHLFNPFIHTQRRKCCSLAHLADRAVNNSATSTMQRSLHTLRRETPETEADKGSEEHRPSHGDIEERLSTNRKSCKRFWFLQKLSYLHLLFSAFVCQNSQIMSPNQSPFFLKAKEQDVLSKTCLPWGHITENWECSLNLSETSVLHPSPNSYFMPFYGNYI
jgi:hypothetical protein